MCSRQQDRITQESAAELERLGKAAVSEREDLVKKFEDERTQLVQQLANLQRDKDQAMLLAETEKQQQLNLLEQEKFSLNEKLKAAVGEQHDTAAELERTRKEAAARLEQDKQSIGQLTADLRKLKQALEEAACVF